MCRVLGTSLPTEGPGLSACIRYICEPPASGRIASRNTSTPIPPIQCVKLRQNSVQCESTSTSGTTLAPVVVKPETVSNSASVKRGISPEKTKGRAPKILSTIQQRATVTKPSFIKNAIRRGFLRIAGMPSAAQISAAYRKESAARSPYMPPTAAETARNNPSIASTQPRIYEITR